MLAVLVGVSALFSRASVDIDARLDLYSFAGNLDVAQYAALLADPGWTVSGSYAPLVKVPGVTASWKRGGFLNLPYLEADGKTLTLQGDEIRREGTNLRFRLPRHTGFLRYRLTYVTVGLAPNPYDRITPLEVPFAVTSRGSEGRSPVIVNGGSFQLRGSLTVTGAGLKVASIADWGQDAQGRYRFPPMHRFSLYRYGYQFTVRDVKPSEPLPDDLQGRKIYQATLDARDTGGHRIEYIEILSAKGEDDGRIDSDRLNYKILYVDGEPISYTQDRGNGQYRKIEWGDDGRPTYFDGPRLNTALPWNRFCSSTGRCDTPEPSAELEADVRADARRVRGWFPQAASVE
ncbi:MAG: hypothetical protein LBG44_03955 [Gemmatimonadota bacterium]|jgi:hypothetical protein|nr:hypothetical protein [Gemmatimonadota bacterium]